MATEVARLKAYLDADTDQFDRKMGRSHGKFSKVSMAMKAGLIGLGAAAIYGLGKAAKIGWDEFNQGQAVAAQTAAVLKSTGRVANVTGKDVDRLGEALMRKSGIDDEVIKSGQNMLLTFTSIRNEAGKGNRIFDQATKAALDLSVATGKDLVSANVMVGKALNDPVRGLTALRRVGVQFTKGQEDQIKKMVKNGKTMEAQKLILRELRREFGGSAEAAGKTLGGQINILRERFNNWAGDMVARAMPAITKFAQDAMPKISTAIAFAQEKGQQFMAWFRGSLLPAIQSVIETARFLWEKLGADIRRNFQAYIAVIRNALNVVIGIVEFFAAVLRGDWSAAWEALKKIAKNALSSLVVIVRNWITNVGRVGKALGSALKDGILAGLSGLGDLLASALRSAVNWLIGKVNDISGKINKFSPFADIPAIPMLASGGSVARTGLAIVHRGESIIPASVVNRGLAGTGGQVVNVYLPRGSVIVDGAKLLRLIDDARSGQFRRGRF